MKYLTHLDWNGGSGPRELVVCDFVNQSGHRLSFLVRYNHQSYSGRQQEIRVWAIFRQNTCFFNYVVIIRFYWTGKCMYWKRLLSRPPEGLEYKINLTNPMDGDFDVSCVTPRLLSLPLRSSRVAIIWNPFPVSVTTSQYHRAVVKLSPGAEGRVLKPSNSILIAFLPFTLDICCHPSPDPDMPLVLCLTQSPCWPLMISDQACHLLAPGP